MGLDLFLGATVLVAALRGWFRGFLLQAIRLAGLVGCIFLADPLRDLARPHVLPYLQAVRPDLVDRLLWWGAAALAYVVPVGLATWAVKLYRRRPYGEPEPHRGDQGAGFLLGTVKGLVVAAFLVAGLQRYALVHLNKIGWIEEQTRRSKALELSERYRPAEKIWDSPPVQHLVARVRSRGLMSPAPPAATAARVPAARQARSLELGRGEPPPLALPDADLAEALRHLRAEMDGADALLNSR